MIISMAGEPCSRQSASTSEWALDMPGSIPVESPADQGARRPNPHDAVIRDCGLDVEPFAPETLVTPLASRQVRHGLRHPMDTSTDRAAPAGLATGAAPGSAAAEAARKKGSRKAVAFVLLSIAAAGGAAYYAEQRHFEETDDAQIDGEISSVGSRIAGTVTSTFVREGQDIKSGAPLVELDPADFEVMVEQARAQVALAEAQLKAEDPSVDIAQTSNSAAATTAQSDIASAYANVSASKQAVSQFAAQLEQARANDRQIRLDKERDTSLLASRSISQAEYDRAESAAAASAAGVKALEQSLAAARDRVSEAAARASQARTHFAEIRSNAPLEIDTRKASVSMRRASLDLARAGLRQAELNLSYTHVLSPVDGVVSKKGVAIGDRIAPGQQLFAIAQTKRIWVTANFRETQLRDIRPGQRAKVHVDALGVELNGTVEAIGGATGSRLSILPPENASGNYVKVVQRIPVRIRLDEGQAGMAWLRPGMSVEPEVRVR
jgi:membrane fusion protein (multidrug efflux system)